MLCPVQTATEHGKAIQGSVPGRAAPNTALHLTAYSVRSCVAPASGRGSPRALGATPQDRAKLGTVISAENMVACDGRQ
jgi:hypothetical protein